MADQDNGHGKSRLDRIEGIIETLAGRQALIEDEFARLLKAQVVMVDSMTTMSDTVTTMGETMTTMSDTVTTMGDTIAAVERRSDERQRRADELNRQSDERLNALIAIVDDLIRRGPLQPPRA